MKQGGKAGGAADLADSSVRHCTAEEEVDEQDSTAGGEAEVKVKPCLSPFEIKSDKEVKLRQLELEAANLAVHFSFIQVPSAIPSAATFDVNKLI